MKPLDSFRALFNRQLKFVVVCGLLFGGATLYAQPPTEWCRPETRLEGGMWAIMAEVKPGQPRWWLLGSAFSSSWVCANTQREDGLSAASDSATGKDTTTIAPFVLHVGKLEFEIRKGRQFSDPTRLQKRFSVPIAGILGSELFAQTAVEFDPVKRRVSLLAAGTLVPQPAAVVLPVRIDRGVPYCTVTLRAGEADAKDASAIVDTVSYEALRCMPTFELPSSREALATQTVSAIRVGNAVFERVPVAPAYPDETRTKGPWDMVLGNGVLSRFYVTFDLANERLLLERTPTCGRGFAPDLGCTIRRSYKLRFASDAIPAAPTCNWEFWEIERKSLAERIGIQEGDELIQLAGFDPAELDWGTICTLLCNPSTDGTKLVVKGVGAARTIMVPSP